MNTAAQQRIDAFAKKWQTAGDNGCSGPEQQCYALGASRACRPAPV